MVALEGYKQTAIGIIPEDWEIVTLQTLFDITSSKRVFQSEWRSSGVPFYRARELAVLSETGRVENELFISHEMYEKYSVQYGNISLGDILITGVGTLGKVYVVKKGDIFYFKDGNIIWLRSKHKVNSNYIRQLYFTPALISQVFGSSAGTTVGTYTITNAKETIVPLPPRPEQHAIAEVLSDMDGYIASLEKLIAKKKAIKQGAMQELLTGKRRLPGVEGEWEKQTLSDISKNIVMGQSPSSKYYNLEGKGLPLIQGNADIDNRKTIIRAYTSQITKEAMKGDIILTVRAPVGNVAKATFNCCLGRGVCSISSTNDYLYHWLIYYEPKWDSLSSGSTFDSINGDELRKITFNFPSDEQEQPAIAAILSDMDAEIESLIAKLNKAKLIKQGMMQELLTGRIRLVSTYPIQNEFGIPEYMVILAIITKLFTDKGMKFLKHMRYQKLVYLYLVYKKAKTDIFEKWDYGPFSKELAYTVVPKAENEKLYIATDDNKNICIGKNINEAVENAINRGYYKGAEQLAGKIRYKKDTELEVLATVIESIRDLEISQNAISLQTIKEYIGSIPIWKPKLSLEYFTDLAIDKSIKEYYGFFK
jgi:type I restriction enzyme S subunit